MKVDAESALRILQEYMIEEGKEHRMRDATYRRDVSNAVVIFN